MAVGISGLGVSEARGLQAFKRRTGPGLLFEWFQAWDVGLVTGLGSCGLVGCLESRPRLKSEELLRRQRLWDPVNLDRST